VFVPFCPEPLKELRERFPRALVPQSPGLDRLTKVGPGCLLQPGPEEPPDSDRRST